MCGLGPTMAVCRIMPDVWPVEVSETAAAGVTWTRRGVDGESLDAMVAEGRWWLGRVVVLVSWMMYTLEWTGCREGGSVGRIRNMAVFCDRAPDYGVLSKSL